MIALKRACGASAVEEIKLRDLSETQYLRFLDDLASLHGALYAVAFDSGSNTAAEVAQHQAHQAANVIRYIDRITNSQVKEQYQQLSDRIAELSLQLYVQLICQTMLLAEIVGLGITFFAQRVPRSLGRLRWRVDAKDTLKTAYEVTLELSASGFLQTQSLREPGIGVVEADYSRFDRYCYTAESRPTYLQDEYGIELNPEAMPINLRLLLHEDMAFVDSKANVGVQIADLLASGLRRLARQGFTDNERAAACLGRLMVESLRGPAEAQRPEPPLRLLTFSDQHAAPDAQLTDSLDIMQEQAQPFLTD